jgi:hypothetical protein
MANRFSERVKLLMSKHGWSMRDLSRQSGIPYSTIYDVLESGKTQPDNLTARNLKRLVGCVLGLLMSPPDTVGHPISMRYHCCHCVGASMLLDPPRRHMRGAIFGTLGLANSIPPSQ